MRLCDAVNQLSSLIPQFVDNFSFSSEVTASSVSGVVTVTTPSELGLSDGDVVTVVNQPIRTSLSTISKTGTTFYISTSEDNDLTYGYQLTATLGGFDDDSFNASFVISGVENRQNFSISSSNSLPTLSGNEYLEEVVYNTLNGRFEVQVIDENTFSFQNDNLEDGDYTFTINYGVRIAGCVDYDSVANGIYKQDQSATSDKCWMFVYMNNMTTSKDRNTDSDARASRTASDDPRTRVVESISVVVFIPTTQMFGGVEAVDLANYTFLPAILKSINGIKFDNGMSGKNIFKLNFTDAEKVEYNRAYYSHQYNFESVFDITQDDNVSPTDSRAFRDIDGNLSYSDPMSFYTSLDDDPLN